MVLLDFRAVAPFMPFYVPLRPFTRAHSRILSLSTSHELISDFWLGVFVCVSLDIEFLCASVSSWCFVCFSLDMEFLCASVLRWNFCVFQPWQGFRVCFSWRTFLCFSIDKDFVVLSLEMHFLCATVLTCSFVCSDLTQHFFRDSALTWCFVCFSLDMEFLCASVLTCKFCVLLQS